MPGRRACSLCHEPGHRRDRCPHRLTEPIAGRWHVELLEGSLSSGTPKTVARAPTLDQAMALAAELDGKPLEWDQPYYFDGWVALGRHGSWLLQERDALPAEMYEAPARPIGNILPDPVVTTPAGRAAWDRRHRAAR